MLAPTDMAPPGSFRQNSVLPTDHGDPWVRFAKMAALLT
jgi:hypothetical protein